MEIALLGLYILLSYPLNAIFCRMHYNKRIKGVCIDSYSKQRELDELSVIMFFSPLTFLINLGFYLIHVICVIWTEILNTTLFYDKDEK